MDTQQEPTGPFEGARLLLVDDSPDIRVIMQQLLEMDGAKVTTAEDRPTAFRCAFGRQQPVEDCPIHLRVEVEPVMSEG
ncbi:hypothetical protein HCU66_07385 [Pseudomonas frederiksbergensis]|nr:hypothetical protein [Pseudomonas frederiksbergensis]